MAEDEDKVTINRKDLAAFVDEKIAEGVKREKMPDEEKRLRGIIGEVFDERLSEFFATNAGENDGGAGGEDEGKPKGKSLIETLLGG